MIKDYTVIDGEWHRTMTSHQCFYVSVIVLLLSSFLVLIHWDYTGNPKSKQPNCKVIDQKFDTFRKGTTCAHYRLLSWNSYNHLFITKKQSIYFCHLLYEHADVCTWHPSTIPPLSPLHLPHFHLNYWHQRQTCTSKTDSRSVCRASVFVP